MSCESPIVIPNPNLHLDKVVKKGYAFLKDTESATINIPCGRCPSCIANKQMQLVQRIQMEAEHFHLFMCTVTYNNEFLPIVHLSDGYKIRYADYKDPINMFKRLRKNHSFPRDGWRYFMVSERGSKRGRPHFHILFELPKYKDDRIEDCYSLQEQLWRIVLANWCRNVGTRKNPIYKPLLTYKKKYVNGQLFSNYDLHYVDPSLTDAGVADVAFYVLKYMTKPSERENNLRIALKLNLPEDEFYKVWSLVRSRWSASLDFGLSKNEDVRKYLKECIKKTPRDAGYPFYINPVSGQTFPLSRFYRSKPDIFSIDDAVDFYFNFDPNVNYSDPNRDQQLKKWREFDEKTDKSLNRGASVYFDELL